MENAVATEIYRKHDGRLHFPLKLECAFINAKSSARATPESSRCPIFATHELNCAILTSD